MAATPDRATTDAFDNVLSGYFGPPSLSSQGYDQSTQFLSTPQDNDLPQNPFSVPPHPTQEWLVSRNIDPITIVSGNHQQHWETNSRIPGNDTPLEGFQQPMEDDHIEPDLSFPMPRIFAGPVPLEYVHDVAKKKRKANIRSRPSKRRATKEVPHLVTEATDSRNSQRVGKGYSRAKVLDLYAIQACEALLASRRRRSPPRKHIRALSNLFNVDPDCMLQWFRLQEDSGYQTKSLSASDLGIALRYRHGKPTKNNTQESISKDSYPCASEGCDIRSRNKGDWKRHQKQHWPPCIWICHNLRCRSHPGEEGVWVRDDKFKVHRNSLGEELDRSELDRQAVPVDSHFPRKCHFGNCAATFTRFDDRCDHMFDVHLATRECLMWREPEKTCNCDDKQSIHSSEDKYDDSSSEGSSGDDDQPSKDPRPGGGTDSNRGHTCRGSRSHSGYDAQQSMFNSHFAGSSYTQQRLPSQSCQRTLRQRPWALAPIAPVISVSYSMPSVVAVSSPWQFNHLPVGYLGSGGSARVDKLRFSDPAVTLARKTIQYHNADQKRRAMRETLVMSRLNHLHTVRFVAACMEQQSVQILMEPVANCNLSQLLFTPLEGPLMRSHASFWFSCLANALNYIHESGVRHLDIKPSNILIFELNVYIADFGTSNFVDDVKSITSEYEAVTRRYAAPEILHGQRGRASDVFALGCVFLELAVALLHQCPHDLDAFNRNDPSRKNYVSTYSGNLDLLAEQISEHRRFATSTGNAAFFNLVLDCCYSAIISNSKDRPTAADLASLLAPQSCYHSAIQVQLTPKVYSATPAIHPPGALSEAQIPALTDSSEDGSESSCSSEDKSVPAMFALPRVVDKSLQDRDEILFKEHSLSLSTTETLYGPTLEEELDFQILAHHSRMNESLEYREMLLTTAYKVPTLQVSSTCAKAMKAKSLLHFWLEDCSSCYERFLVTGCSER